MKTNIIWAELHSPLFLAGTNLGLKMDPSKRQGLVMEFDEEKCHLYVQYNGATARVPEPSILSMVEGELKKPIKETPPPYVKKVVTAQVSTPQGHVFEGPGAGKTGRDK